MLFPIVLLIIPSGNNGWDLGNTKTITFHNKLKALFFARYYTDKNDCLIRYCTGGNWIATYCKGKEIWNCY